MIILLIVLFVMVMISMNWNQVPNITYKYKYLKHETSWSNIKLVSCPISVGTDVSELFLR